MSIGREKVDQFIEHIVASGKALGISLSHEDCQGAFRIVPYSERAAAHLRAASISLLQKEATADTPVLIVAFSVKNKVVTNDGIYAVRVPAKVLQLLANGSEHPDPWIQKSMDLADAETSYSISLGMTYDENSECFAELNDWLIGQPTAGNKFLKNFGALPERALLFIDPDPKLSIRQWMEQNGLLRNSYTTFGICKEWN